MRQNWLINVDRTVRLIVIGVMVVSLLGTPLAPVSVARAQGAGDDTVPTATATPVLTAEGNTPEVVMTTPVATETNTATAEGNTAEAVTTTPVETETNTATPDVSATTTPTSDMTATSEPTPSATDTMSVTTEPTAILSNTVSLTQTIISTDTLAVGEALTVEIAPSGGELIAPHGRVKVSFPAGVANNGLEVSYQRRYLAPGQTQRRGPPTMPMMFDLHAWVARGSERGQAMRHFPKPLAFTVDLSDWQLPANMDGRMLWFGYYNEDTQTWDAIPFKLDRANGGLRLRAEVDHFSTFGVKTEANPGWRMAFNEPQVGLATGAATYNYPINVPAGRNGLQPDLSLNYNSQAVDHQRGWYQSDWVGHGWSLGTIEVTRRLGNDSTYSAGDCKNEFSLVFNGTGYTLLPETSGVLLGRYYTQEDSALYIELINDPIAGNMSKQYWVIRDGNGTAYRLGWNPDAEQRVRCVDGSYQAFRWRADLATDNYGNQMLFTYTEDFWIFCPGTNPGYAQQMDRSNYLSQIFYNAYGSGQWHTRIDFNRAGRPNATPQDDNNEPCNKLFFQSHYLDNIAIYVDGSLTHKYQLGSTLYVDSGRLGDNYTPAQGMGSRELTSLTEYAYDVNGVSSALPTTTFSYIPLPTSNQRCTPGNDCGSGPGRCYPKGWCSDDEVWDDGQGKGTFDCDWMGTWTQFQNGEGVAHPDFECFTFYYWRLSEVQNGYGGKTTFSYGNDNRAEFQLDGWTYRVTQRQVSPNNDANNATWEYTYGTPCYRGGVGSSGGFMCLAIPPATNDNALVAHTDVLVTAKDYNGSVQSVTKHYFSTSDPVTTTQHSKIAGREYRTEQYDTNGTTLLTVAQMGHTITDLPNNRWSVNLTWQSQQMFDGANSVTRQTTYAYDTWGNLLKQSEFDGNTLVRCTLRAYYPNTTPTTWLVHAPAYENVYAQDCFPGTGQLMGSTRYSYDGQPNFAIAPVKGELTAVRQWVANQQLLDTYYTYDQWGNRRSESTYNGYGTEATFAKDMSGVTASTSWTSYDPLYNLYPVASSNALGQASYAAYDYRLGVPLDTTDPNGVVTYYSYDVFGRLTGVARPNDTLTLPTVAYVYQDGIAPFRVTTIQREQSGSATLTRSASTFYDGLGRAIQTKSESLDGAQNIIVDTVYDGLGRAVQVSAPRYVNESGSAFTNYTVPGALYTPTLTQYDALGRVTQVTAPDGTTTRQVYRIEASASDNDFAGGRQTTYSIDANQHFKRQSFDALGNVQTVSEAYGIWPSWVNEPRTHYVHDALGRLTQVRDTLENTTNITYNFLGQKQSMSDPDMGYWRYVYDLNGNLAAQTDALGQVTHFTYDALQRLAVKRPMTVTYADSFNTTFSPNWQANGSGTATVSGGQLTLNASAGSVYVARTASLAGDRRAVLATFKVSSATNAALLYLKSQPGDGSTLRIAGLYLYNGRFASSWYSSTTSMSSQDLMAVTANTWYQVLLVADGAQGFVVSVWERDNPSRRMEHQLTLPNASNRTWTFVIDQNLSGPSLTLDDYQELYAPSNIRYTYDSVASGNKGVGRRTGMSDATGSTAWTYDPRGRVTNETKLIDGVTYNTSTAYDAADRVTSLTYPNGEVVNQTYNPQGALETVKSATYNQWYASNLDYNANGSLAQLNLGNGTRTLYGYYGFTAKAWDANPSLGLTSYGRLWQARTEAPNGATVQDFRYTYDPVGNVTSLHTLPRTVSAPPTFTLTDTFATVISSTLWGTSGNIASVSGAAVLTGTNANWNTYLYRKSYTLLTGTGMQVRFMTNQAQASFILGLENNDPTYRRFSVVGQSGQLYLQYFDGADWRTPTILLPTLAANTWYVLRFRVDDARGLTVDVVKESDQADLAKHASYTLLLAPGKAWRFRAWQWSATQIGLDDYKEFNTAVTYTPDEKLNFTYDPLDRLTGVSQSFTEGYTANYTYDLIGNLKTKVENAAPLQTYDYGAQRPHAVNSINNGAAASYTYNANGDVATRTENGKTYQHLFDAENRLSVVTNTTSGAVTKFYYDGDGARVKQEVTQAGGVTTTVYVGGGMYEVTTVLVTSPPSTATSYRLTYAAGGQSVAVRACTSNAANCTGTLSYLHTDHLNSSSTATDANGVVTSRTSYFAYGAVRSTTGAMPTKRGYTGQYADDATGLMYYNARYYSPSLGKFVSPDTIVPGAGDPQAFNRYAYVKGNPMKFTDPSGHMQEGPKYKSGVSWRDKKQKDDEYQPTTNISSDNYYSDRLFPQTPEYIKNLDYAFDPFLGPMSSNYGNSETEIADMAMLTSYDHKGVDLENIAKRGISNPLSEADFREVSDGASSRLMLNAHHTPYVLFLDEMNLSTDIRTNPTNFESNYLEALMRNYPDKVKTARLRYVDILVVQDALNNFGDGLLQARPVTKPSVYDP